MKIEAPAELQAMYAPIAEEFEALQQYLDNEFSAREAFIGQILAHVARFRGKQMRPALLFLVSRLAGGAPRQDQVKIAAVVELIHTATLVHDDILDDADLRRSVETVHRRWGERAAVLIGDYIYSRAFHISTEVRGMASVLSETTHTICEGELLQISSRFQPEIGEARYFEIIRKKTAILHAISCRLGGTLGGMDEERAERFYEFGMNLGLAFQIADDCLDYSGKEAETGKSLGTDLHQGKVTLPLIYLLDSLDHAEASWVKEVLRKPLSSEDEARIHGLIEERGVVGEALSQANAYVEAAKRILAEVVPSDAPSRESLDLMADYVVRRQR